MSAPGADGLDVVVVAYGPADSLAGCLSALGRGPQVLVVDNSSSPQTAAVAGDHGARYIDPGANLGFGAAVNLALEHRKAGGQDGGPGSGGGGQRDVLLLNPDARIGPDAVARLRAVLDAHTDVACAAPAQHAPGSDVAMRARWPWHTPAGAWAEAVGLTRRRLASSRYFVGGAVLLVRGAALDDVGRFDERFFLYSEDEDWERRAVRRGWTVRYCPDITAEHAGGGTDASRTRVRLRLHAAIERYVRKWYGSLGWAVFRAGTLVGLGVRVAARRGAHRRSAVALCRLYLEGPDRAARRTGAVPPPINGP